MLRCYAAKSKISSQASWLPKGCGRRLGLQACGTKALSLRLSSAAALLSRPSPANIADESLIQLKTLSSIIACRRATLLGPTFPRNYPRSTRDLIGGVPALGWYTCAKGRMQRQTVPSGVPANRRPPGCAQLTESGFPRLNLPRSRSRLVLGGRQTGQCVGHQTGVLPPSALPRISRYCTAEVGWQGAYQL